MWLVFLDDERVTSDVTWENYSQWSISFTSTIRDYEHFCKFVDVAIENKFNPEMFIFSFDHDLGEGKDGYDCSKYLVNKLMDSGNTTPLNFVVHSKNPIGKRNIEMFIQNYNKTLSGR